MKLNYLIFVFLFICYHQIDIGEGAAPTPAPPTGPQPPPNNQTYGTPLGGFPSYVERAYWTLLNTARLGPQGFRNIFLGVTLDIMNYPAVKPLVMRDCLNRAARNATQWSFDNGNVTSSDMVARGTAYCGSSGLQGFQVANSRIRGFMSTANTYIGYSTASMPVIFVRKDTCDMAQNSATCASSQTPDNTQGNVRETTMSSSYNVVGLGVTSGTATKLIQPGFEYEWISQNDLWGFSPAPAINKIVSGAHIVLPSQTTYQWYANYYDTLGAPTSYTIVVNGSSNTMNLPSSSVLGSTSMGTYTYSQNIAPGCSYYHFEFKDKNGVEVRYPEWGEFLTFGVNNCDGDWICVPSITCATACGIVPYDGCNYNLACGSCPIAQVCSNNTCVSCSLFNNCGAHGHCNSTTQCICDPGWSGSKCTTSVCDSNNGGCDVKTTCSVSVTGTPVCSSCPANYSGDGETGCYFNYCVTDNGGCDILTNCTAYHNGSTSCTTCPKNYLGDGKSGCYYDSCVSNNGGCDPLTSCTTYRNGTITCSDCPANYLGTGKTGCYYNDCLDSNGGCDLQTTCTVYPNGTTSCSNCPTNYLGSGKTSCYYNYCLDSNGGCDALTNCEVYPNGTTICSNCPANHLGTGKTGCYYDHCLDSNGGCDIQTTCTTFPNATTSCSNCPVNYLGTGKTGCYYDSCLNSNGGCDAQTTCTVYPNGTTSCSDCPENYLGTGKTGCYKNFCTTNNGGCDPLTNCSVYPNGTVMCTSCPANYTGEGKTGCFYNNCTENACDPLVSCAQIGNNITCGPCPIGYIGDGVSGCKFDNCRVNNGGCSPFSNCSIFSNGTSVCGPCRAGYQGDGYNCIDNCEINNGGCSPLANCTTLSDGTSVCGPCFAGYQGNGYNCTDFDECKVGPNNCSALSWCNNTIGSYNCICLSGYNGTGFDCWDINECENTSICSPNATCKNLPGTYSCSCNSGFIGDGKTCTNISVCAEFLLSHTCDANAHCTANSSGAAVCACNTGYNGTGSVCTDIDECILNLDNCTTNANCINTIGSFNCSCNTGFSGDGYNCTGCGDGICGNSADENCVLCPSDCGLGICGVCGDGSCNSTLGENCTSCYQDCGSCATQCPDCDYNGQCVDGHCFCKGSWTGPNCKQVVVYSNVTVNPTNPQINIIPQNNTQQQTQPVYFGVSVGFVREMNRNIAIQTLDCSTLNFTVTKSVNKTYSLWNYEAAIFPSTDLAHKRAILPQQSTIKVAIYNFNQSSTLNFANRNISFPENSLKIFVTVNNWPFVSIRNSLSVELSISSPPPSQQNQELPCGSTQPTPPTDLNIITDTNSTKWITVTGNGYTLYASLLSAAELDGRVVNINFTKSDNKIILNIPYFWSSAVVDPDFSIFYNDIPITYTVNTDCGTQTGLTWQTYVYIAVGSAVIIGVVIFVTFFVKKRLRIRRQKSDISMRIMSGKY